MKFFSIFPFSPSPLSHRPEVYKHDLLATEGELSLIDLSQTLHQIHGVLINLHIVETLMKLGSQRMV